MKKIKILIILLAILAAGVIGWPKLIAETLELKDVYQFDSKEEVIDGKVSLRVKGLSGHSAYVVKSVEESVVGDEINIIVAVRPSLLKKGTGNFDSQIKIPDNVNKISFGKERHIIWKRS